MKQSDILEAATLIETLKYDDPYCVYLTVYSGEALPPFYIGHSTVKKVDEGYHGSVLSKKYKEIWRKELEQNPGSFSTVVLSKHSTKIEANEREAVVQHMFAVVESENFANLAYAQPAFFFHNRHSQETKQKISEKSKLQRHNVETRLKMSESQKKIMHPKASEETRLKMSLSRRGKKQSPELIAKRAAAATGKKRKSHSAETKLLLSAKNTGRTFGADFRKNVSEGQRHSRGYDFLLQREEEKVLVRSLLAFCTERGLPYSSLIACFKEGRSHRSGWLVTKKIFK